MSLSERDFSVEVDRISASPNFGPRRGAGRPGLIVVHYTAMESAEAARARLCDPAAEVSAHYLLTEGGEIWGLVSEAERAWHAGRSSWFGETDVNSASIGIELAHRGGEAAWSAAPFPEAQMAALERVLRAAMRRWEIPAENVVGHSDVAPGRKIDPGASFDWGRLARRGLARAAPPLGNAAGDDAAATDGEARFLAAARRLGYGDWPVSDVLDAFRRRWRPTALGAPLDGRDAAMAERLAAT